MNTNTNAIETLYNGYRFRSRLEARWAIFFDAMNIAYIYEPDCFRLSSGELYLPDFYLPRVSLRTTENDVGIFIEIKPTYTDEEADKYDYLFDLAKVTGIPCALLVGMPYFGRSGLECEDPEICGHFQYAFDEQEWWDNYMRFMHCPTCDRVKYEYDEGNYMECEYCASRGRKSPCTPDSPKLEQACAVARAHRFDRQWK